MSSVLKILLIEDDTAHRVLIRRSLRQSKLGVDLHEAATCAEGLRIFVAETFDCVLLDHGLPDGSGADLLPQLLAGAELGPPIVMLTAMNNPRLALKLLEEGAVDYLDKSEITPAVLERTVRFAIARQEARSVEIRERLRVVRLAEQNAELLRELEVSNGLLATRNQRLAELSDNALKFVDNVSHEFRTPLTVIKEFTSVMHDGLVGEVNAEQLDLLEIVLQQADHLGIMITDMLDTSELEAGLLRIARRTCRIEEIIEQNRVTLASRAKSGQVTFEVAVGDLPSVFCDPEKIGRVIINLAINAFKFSGAQGRVRLSARHDPEHQQVVISVGDNGPGIAAEDLKIIFERFKQLEGGGRTSIKGFGLGLSIARELVLLNLGNLSVESRQGAGSTFSFTIPTSDPRHLIRRYIEWRRHLHIDSELASLIVAEVPAPVTADLLDDAAQFLLGHVRATDLLYRPDPKRGLIVAPDSHQEASLLVKRLQEDWTVANRNRLGDPLPPIDFDVRGSWHMAHQAADLIAGFEVELTGAAPARALVA